MDHFPQQALFQDLCSTQPDASQASTLVWEFYGSHQHHICNISFSTVKGKENNC